MNHYQVTVKQYSSMLEIKRKKRIHITLHCIGNKQELPIPVIVTEESHLLLYLDLCDILTELDKYIPKFQTTIKIPIDRLKIEINWNVITSKTRQNPINISAA